MAARAWLDVSALLRPHQFLALSAFFCLNLDSISIQSPREINVISGPDFFKSMALALTDFVDLNQVSPLVELFEDLNERKHLPHMPEMLHLLSNVANYLECIPLETPSQQPWGLFLPHFENFLRKFVLLLPAAGNLLFLYLYFHCLGITFISLVFMRSRLASIRAAIWHHEMF